jgi:hypothetical protein
MVIPRVPRENDLVKVRNGRNFRMVGAWFAVSSDEADEESRGKYKVP